MAQDEASSSSMTSTPHQQFISISPNMLGSPYGYGALCELTKSDERGLCLIHLLGNCAHHVAAGAFDPANACVEHILVLASPNGDAMQRIACHFTDALVLRLLRPWPALSCVLYPSTRLPSPAETLLARRHFFELCPFLRLAFVVSNQAILDAMEGERVVHVIDLCTAEPAQWLTLLQAFSARPEGPPHLRITGIHEHKELLDHTAIQLSEEAQRLDIPFQFNPVVSRLEKLDLESLQVKSGEALAVSSVLQLHCLLASDDDRVCLSQTPTPSGKSPSPCITAQLHRLAQMSDRTLGELLLEKEYITGCIPTPDWAMSSPFPLTTSAKMESFLASLWALSPKIVVLAEQESNHNGPTMNERFIEALNFYAALFDCMEATVPGAFVERARVEGALFGEEIRNIVACEGLERRKRHERLEQWAQRMLLRGFDRVPLSYDGLLEARRLLHSCGSQGYNVRDENGCFQFCWKERALFSVSAWRCRQ